jgi:predicted nuclease of predicted toxin-antitoxin system
MEFVLDENVPVSVGEMLSRHGHDAKSIRDYIPEGSPDPLVAAIAEKVDATLVSFDGDFEKIAPRIPVGARRRFRKLSRIWMQCSEYQA